MKRGLAFLVVLMLVVGTCQVVIAGSQANLTINATIIAPLQVQLANGLDFGILMKGSPELMVNPITPAQGTTPALFNVTGEPNTAYVVTLPSETTISNGGTVLTVHTFATSLTNNEGMLNPSGVSSFKVGATLSAIPLNALSGTYTGTTTIEVVYKF